MGMSRVVACASALGTAMLVAQVLSAQPAPTTWSGVYAPAQALAGEGVYLERCADCHQPDLSGGEDAPALAGAQFSARWNGRSLGDLFQLMRRAMPKEAPGSLTPPDYAAVIAYLLQQNGFPHGTTPLPSELGTLAGIGFVAQHP